MNRGEWKIHWRDWPSDEETWEPWENLHTDNTRKEAKRVRNAVKKQKRKDEQSRKQRKIKRQKSISAKKFSADEASPSSSTSRRSFSSSPHHLEMAGDEIEVARQTAEGERQIEDEDIYQVINLYSILRIVRSK